MCKGVFDLTRFFSFFIVVAYATCIMHTAVDGIKTHFDTVLDNFPFLDHCMIDGLVGLS